MSDGLFVNDFSQSVGDRQTQHSIQGRLPATRTVWRFASLPRRQGWRISIVRVRMLFSKIYFLFVSYGYLVFLGGTLPAICMAGGNGEVLRRGSS
jgi:hypothetical protein